MMLSKISEALANLSGAERKVAECALAEPKWFVHAAVAEIAEHASVSQPTVIRFCRSLGYKGLPEFKLSLSASIGHEGMPYVHEELNADDDMGGVMEKVLGNTAASILGARRSLKETDLENAIAMLSHARRIEFYGVGNSGQPTRADQPTLPATASVAAVNVFTGSPRVGPDRNRGSRIEREVPAGRRAPCPGPVVR